ANLWLVKERCMHYIRYQIKSILASKGTSLFLNKWKYYIFSFCVRMNLSVVWSQILENPILINNAIKKVDTLVPIIPLIVSLAKVKFCNV
ncbi:hypothetical protein Pfo_026762, partial [Paulownia fortunei]